MKTRFSLLLAASVLSLAAPSWGYIPEPETVIYGRIINRAGPLDQLITEGTLKWKLRRPDGTELLFRTSLDPLDGGRYSYSLTIPHQALSLGQTALPTVVPLELGATTQQLAEITVDDQPATILSPGSALLAVLQAQRGAAHRLDLSIDVPSSDLDGDGIADWWEDANGLDKQLAGDASLDPDGDGRNNLAEFLSGTDPRQDSRHPQLLTSEIIAYARGTSLVVLKTADLDSTAQQLRYTVTETPTFGELRLRNVTALPDTDVKLTAGAIFTQADVLAGRVIYVHDGAEGPDTFKIRVADEITTHPPAEGSVSVLLYDPLPNATSVGAAEAQRLAAHQAATGSLREIVADLSAMSGPLKISAPSGAFTDASYAATFVPAYGEDRRHRLFGGAEADQLTGSMVSDVLLGGPGNDSLTGRLGADRFVFISSDDGSDTITDFRASEGDAIDLTSVLNGTSTLLTDYVQITRSGADALVGVDLSGSRDFTDLVIRLANTPFTQADLRMLSENGHLLTDPAALPPLVTIAATVPQASENGPSTAQFTIARSKAGSAALAVALQISGSATNGVDYQLLQSQVEIPAGAASVTLAVAPFVDAVTESNETIVIAVLPQAAYELGAASYAQVVIEDLKPEVTIEALNGLAEVSTQSPGAFLVERSGVIDRSVLVRLNIKGNATNGVDYNRIDNFYNLSANQTSGVIQIVPKPTAVLQKNAESVILSVKPDAAYRVGEESIASVVIVPEMVDLDLWRNRYFTGNNQSLAAFAGSDPGGFGLPMLLRYGFGLNPASPRSGAAALLPQPEIRNGRLGIRFSKLPAAIDLDYQIEVSSDLRSWRPGGAEVKDVSLLEPLGDPTVGVYQIVKPLQESDVRFVRVRLATQQP